MTTLYQVTTSYMCAGVLVRDGYVVGAAPILRRSIGKHIDTLKDWVSRKRGTLEKLVEI